MLAGLAFRAEAATDRVTVRPADKGGALINPGRGWVIVYYDNALSHYGNREEPHNTLEDFPGLSVAYLQLAWGYIEPGEGEVSSLD